LVIHSATEVSVLRPRRASMVSKENFSIKLQMKYNNWTIITCVSICGREDTLWQVVAM
jgi:hypothetical protein